LPQNANYYKLTPKWAETLEKYQGFIYIGGRSAGPDDEKEVKTEPKESEDDNDTPRWF
jgi:hypothetical protein